MNKYYKTEMLYINDGHVPDVGWWIRHYNEQGWNLEQINFVPRTKSDYREKVDVSAYSLLFSMDGRVIMDNKITILCSPMQREELIKFGYIRNDDDVCGCKNCDKCEYSTDNIIFRDN